VTGPGVSWLACGMREVPADNAWLQDPEAARLDSMTYTKRRTEARLGRWTAKKTVALVAGIDAGPRGKHRVVIRNAPDGAPQAFIDGRPAPMTIAMTDRADWAVCATLPGQRRIGCDLEVVEPRSDRFVRDYFTAAERALVASRYGEKDLLANLIWSAKESALKVLRTGLRRDTRSVEVDLLDGADGDWRPLQVAIDDGRNFPGWWIRHGEFILTVAAEVAIPPPTSLVEPSPLASAIPGHAWTQQMLS
jgi:4'-phosphopantetheinyl transferase